MTKTTTEYKIAHHTGTDKYVPACRQVVRLFGIPLYKERWRVITQCHQSKNTFISESSMRSIFETDIHTCPTATKAKQVLEWHKTLQWRKARKEEKLNQPIIYYKIPS